MYLITNRALTAKKGLATFGDVPNPKGPNELRLVKVEKKGKEWVVTVVREGKDSRLAMNKVKELKTALGLDIDVREPWYPSFQVACELFQRAREERKSILFFVHGYNNDVADVLAAAQAIEALYNVIVVPFTWPANGGGVISGTAAYLSDKADARASAGALNRVVEKIRQYHTILTRAQNQKLQQAAYEKHPNNPTAAASLYAELLEKECAVKISLLCHSMGNYVFKHTLSTGENATSELTFDNISLVAADTNNENHASWMSKLDVRKRVYVVINEDDSALKASRIKPGKEQKARLGHYLKQVNSPNASYVDITGAAHVGAEHTYFKGDTVTKNAALKTMFEVMFNGQVAEDEIKLDAHLSYRAENNTFKFK